MEEREERELQSDSKTALENSAERGFASLPHSGGGGGGGGGARALSGAGSWERGGGLVGGMSDLEAGGGFCCSEKMGIFCCLLCKLF